MEADQDGESIAFRRYRILPRQRRLVVDEDPIKLGARAFDLLLALVEAPGIVVTRDTLISRVWEGRTVTDNNLQVQIASLRNVLGGDRDLIRTVPGRGYQFAGEIVSRSRAAAPSPSLGDAVAPPAAFRTNLPQTPFELIGRAAELDEILALAGSHRLVTLTGAGGVGKTRLAIEAARRFQPQFPDGVWVVEMSSLGEPGSVASAVAATVGLPAGVTLTPDQVAAALSGQHMLIVLDTCEHVIDAAAEMAEALTRLSAGIRVIATSREPLGAYGEWVYRVRPLVVPATDEASPTDCQAASLFIARVRAMNADFAVEEAAATAIGAICRALDGIPLAIELAAIRAATLGPHTLADLLGDHLQLLTCGRRTALPRHQTLRATLDWSYALLPPTERTVLRRLAVFPGEFDLDAACDIAAQADLTPAQATEALANLVTKSLVAAEIGEGSTCYRLMETTRAYALEKLATNKEYETIAFRHAAGASKPHHFDDTAPCSPGRYSASASLRFAA
jgi:predicted ATPase/DNA-binding winged helix-turn-helix (wHTH) protein